MTLTVEPLDDHHDLTMFRSGNAALDDWLKRAARTATGQGTRTYVLVDRADVVGYFSVVPHLLERAEMSKRVAHGAPKQIPAILLAKLALSAHLHGEGLGSELLVRALFTIVAAARTVGGKVVVVDAVDDAASAFYRHHDFQSVPGRPQRLVMKLSTAARAIGVDWP